MRHFTTRPRAQHEKAQPSASHSRIDIFQLCLHPRLRSDTPLPTKRHMPPVHHVSALIQTLTKTQPSTRCERATPQLAPHTHSHEEPTGADGARRNSSDSDLTTWAHLYIGRSGARIRTVCTRGREIGKECSRTVRERRYRDIPRVDGPSEKITIEGVEAMMETDARMEKESDGAGDGEEGWIVISRD